MYFHFAVIDYRIEHIVCASEGHDISSTPGRGPKSGDGFPGGLRSA